MVDLDRLSAAYETARCDLVAESAPSGHWIGQLSSSAHATAAAIAALALVERHLPTVAGRAADAAHECALSQQIIRGLRWLASHQNPDGGWGDTDRSGSNLAATLLVRAAFALTCVPANNPGLLERADAYIKAHGGKRGLRRHHGQDNFFVAPILATCALAGIVPWRAVPSLKFERACAPPWASDRLGLSTASPATPALVAIGQLRFFHRKPWNPITRMLRRASLAKSLEQISDMQPADGGFADSACITSFVVMSLASMDQVAHPIVGRGVEFLLATVRPDGSWPVMANLAVANTAAAVEALASAGEDIREFECLDWLLSRQNFSAPAAEGAVSGGWSASDAVSADVDTLTTASVLLALAHWAAADSPSKSQRIRDAADAGIRWLLDQQQAHGGWSLYCREAGNSPCNASSVELTTQALRALNAWRDSLDGFSGGALRERLALASERGLHYLVHAQQPNGSWLGKNFGGTNLASTSNAISGTAGVLTLLHEMHRLDMPAADRGLAWLVGAMHADGSWGELAETDLKHGASWASVEESAQCAAALLKCAKTAEQTAAADQAVAWLADAVEANRHTHSAPVGLSFARLWYYEKLYPLITTVAALGQSARHAVAAPQSPAAVHAFKR